MSVSAINRQPFPLWKQPTRGFSIKDSLAQLVTQVYTRSFSAPPATVCEFADWPRELQFAVLRYLDLRDLARFSQTSKDSKALISAYMISVAKQINCPIDEESSIPIAQQVFLFVTKLRSDVEALTDRPDDITAMLEAPTIDEINYMLHWLKARKELEVLHSLIDRIRKDILPLANQPIFPNLQIHFSESSLEIEKLQELRQWLQENKTLVSARDTCIVWLTLSRALGLGLPFPDPITVSDLIDLADQFPAWFRDQKENLSQLTKLDLSYRCLSSIPKQILELTWLTKLNLSHNSLTELPNKIDHLTNLTHLEINHNCLTSIPPCIGNLSHLKTLILSNNQLNNLPEEIGKLSKLEILSLNGNLFRSLPKPISQLTTLRELSLDYNLFTAFPLEVINLPLLKTLSLSGNQLLALPPEIAKLTKLKLFSVGHNQLTSLPSKLFDFVYLHDIVSNPLWGHDIVRYIIHHSVTLKNVLLVGSLMVATFATTIKIVDFWRSTDKASFY